MARFPTEVERSITVHAPMGKVYDYLWDVVGSSNCIPGLASCKAAAKDTYRFVYQERTTGPFTLSLQYTARYEGNGKDRITFESIAAKNDNGDCKGLLRLQAAGRDATKITLQQMIAPDTPVPRLLQGLIRSFVETEAADGAKQYLANVKRALEDEA
jgi:carbon monoxide dehydrogenase subunit G